jgi:hypothetical protein
MGYRLMQQEHPVIRRKRLTEELGDLWGGASERFRDLRGENTKHTRENVVG